MHKLASELFGMKYRSGTLILLCVGALMLSGGCSLTEKVFGKKYKNERKMENQQEEFGKTYEALKEAHWNRQPKRTQEMMKESKKRARKLNRSKREPWWKRLLGIDK